MSDHITGQSKVHEVLLLGEVGPEPEKQKSIEWSHLDLEEAIALTRELQVDKKLIMFRSVFNRDGVEHTPNYPAADFANEVHAQIIDALDLWDDQERLKYFTGVHGPSDSCGVDCWFEYTCSDGRVVRALVDHTENPDKKNDRVDYILLVDPDKDMDNGEGFQGLISRTSKAVTKILQEKETQL